MKSAAVRLPTLLSLPALVVGAAACGDGGAAEAPAGPFTLTFAGNASFNEPHGGQAITVILVSVTAGEESTKTGTVSAEAEPAFSVSFPDALEPGQVYEVRYWIDSNFGGGTEGGCDPKETDHQWVETVGTASEDIDLTVSHDPTATESVCAVGAFDLTFDGDASFQGPHGLQSVTIALVRSDGTVAFTDTATISDSEDPSFSFSEASVLLPDVSHAVHLWIDSNFGDGVEGVCDPPSIDHQWSIDLGVVTQDTVVSYGHNAEAATDVCDTFD